MLYRIAEMRDWEAAQASGYFASAGLTAEGFIHCCTAQQLASVANRYYQGQEALLLLEIDETQVHAPITWEDLTNAGQLFPHVYGHIPLAAVTRCLALKPGSDGCFSSTRLVPTVPDSKEWNKILHFSPLRLRGMDGLRICNAYPVE